MTFTSGHVHDAASSGEGFGEGNPGFTVPETAADLLDDNAEDLYDNAPCGYLSTYPDGQIAKVNKTLLGWLGRAREDLVGRLRFADLLTVGGKLYHETHLAPMLAVQGRLDGVALELRTADGGRLPVLVSSTVKYGRGGRPLLIRTTIFDATSRHSYERELLRVQREAEKARAEAEQARALAEVERARLQRVVTTLQRTLLPPTLSAPEGMEVSAYYHVASADQVGGDFYDVFPLSEGRWGFFLGDVCGKGADAAAVTSLVRYTLRAAAVYDPDPVAVLNNLNIVLNHEYNGDDPRFCTVVFGIITPASSGFTLGLAVGGHLDPLLLRADGTADYISTRGGLIVGVFPDPHFATTTVHLAPGDALLLYTDGLVEARVDGADGESDARYGDAALRDHTATLAPTTASDLVEGLTGLLTRFGDGLDDDTALLALSVPTPPERDDQ